MVYKSCLWPFKCNLFDSTSTFKCFFYVLQHFNDNSWNFCLILILPTSTSERLDQERVHCIQVLPEKFFKIPYSHSPLLVYLNVLWFSKLSLSPVYCYTSQTCITGFFWQWPSGLLKKNGLFHEDIAILGQFCAEVMNITFLEDCPPTPRLSQH